MTSPTTPALEQTHAGIAAGLERLRVIDPARELQPLHHEMYARVGLQAGKVVLVVLRTKYGSPSEQGMRLVELSSEPTDTGLVYRVKSSTFIPQPSPYRATENRHLRPAPASRNYRLAVKQTGDHKS